LQVSGRDEYGRFTNGNQYGAPEGNQNALKLKTDDLKLEAYKQYCQWISEGNSKEAWWFEHPELTINWQTMENYIKNDPVVLKPLYKAIAEAKSYAYWLELGRKMMVCEIEKCQPAIYQMFMRNKFKWDKDTEKKLESLETDVRRLLHRLEEQE
jgi:hypothetical protein